MSSASTPSPGHPPAKRKRNGSASPTPSPTRRHRSPSLPRRRRVAPAERSSEAHRNDSSASVAGIQRSGDALRLELAKLSNTRAGGAYIPPARLRALMAEAEVADPGSKEFQKMSWDALKKSVTGLVNKVAADNIKHIVPELFGGANLIRGRGLFCRSIMKAQALSLPFTPVFASLVAVVNTKLPMVGELLVTRLVSQFRRSFKRNDKGICSSTATFIAHLVNQRVSHEILALEILVLLLERPTDDSVEIAVAFMREVGAFLAEESPKANNSIYDRFRAVLYDGSISKRVQYMIEVLSQVRREKYKDNPIIPEALDLVEEEDQITHKIGLDDELNLQEGLNMFKVDPDFIEHEGQYRAVKAEILGENSGSNDSDDSSSPSSGTDSSEDSDEEDADEAQNKIDIQDRTETNMVNLRRTIYLTIMSSAIFEEATHKLLKLNIPEGQEIELCNMIVECCSQERSFSRFYGNIGERLSKLNRKWSGLFEECFRAYYDSIHRYETNRLRNIARFFGALLATDSISWASFEIVHMNEDDTTSSSRIFIKILFQELLETLGMKDLVIRFAEPSMQDYYVNIFPTDNPKHTRFSVNFFTSIGLGALTEGMREHLKKIPLLLQQQREAALAAKAARAGNSSSSDSDSDNFSDPSNSASYSSSVLSESTGGSYSRSGSYSPKMRRRTPPQRVRDAFSPDRSVVSSVSPRNRRGPSRSWSSDSRSSPPSRSRAPQSRREGRECRSYTPDSARSYSSRSSYTPSPRRHISRHKGGSRGRSISRTPPSLHSSTSAESRSPRRPCGRNKTGSSRAGRDSRPASLAPRRDQDAQRRTGRYEPRWRERPQPSEERFGPPRRGYYRDDPSCGGSSWRSPEYRSQDVERNDERYRSGDRRARDSRGGYDRDSDRDADCRRPLLRQGRKYRDIS